jgi:hypothetical protein
MLDPLNPASSRTPCPVVFVDVQDPKHAKKVKAAKSRGHSIVTTGKTVQQFTRLNEATLSKWVHNPRKSNANWSWLCELV